MKVRDFFQSLKYSLLHLLYPKQCLHCQTILDPRLSYLCEDCSALLERIEEYERCLYCFDFMQNHLTSKCDACIHEPLPFFRIASVFEYSGPAASIVKRFKYANEPYLASGMGAFLYAQFCELNWPLPDAIVSVPLSLTHWYERGYNQSELLAVELGKYIQRPVWNNLKRKSGAFSQVALSFEERKMLKTNEFYFKKKFLAKYPTILVIDDVLTTGSTLKRCGEALMDNGCGKLYALTFCRTTRV